MSLAYEHLIVSEDSEYNDSQDITEKERSNLNHDSLFNISSADETDSNLNPGNKNGQHTIENSNARETKKVGFAGNVGGEISQHSGLLGVSKSSSGDMFDMVMGQGRDNNSNAKLSNMFAELSLDDLEEPEGSQNQNQNNLNESANGNQGEIGDTSDLFQFSDLTELENKFGPLEDIDELTFMASMVDEEYNPAHEQMLLQEVDSFLKEKKPTPYEYMMLKQEKVNHIEVKFIEFLRARRLEINIQDCRKIIKEKVLPKIKVVDDKILRKKEQHINHIKALRAFSKFSKGDLENFANENFELKKQLNEKDTYIKLLKVELVKVTKADYLPNKVKKRIDQLVKIQNVINSGNDRQSLAYDKTPQNYKKQSSLLSSTTTRASLNNSQDGLRYKEENRQLKETLRKNEAEYKIKIGQMKAIYEGYLKEINKRGSNNVASNLEATNLHGKSCFCKKKDAEDFEPKKELAIQRIKNSKLKAKLEKSNKEVEEQRKQILELKKTVGKLSSGVSNKKIAKLENKIENLKAEMIALEEKNTLKYHIDKEFNSEDAEMVNKALKIIKNFSKKSDMPMAKFGKHLRNCFWAFLKSIFQPVFVVSRKLGIILDDFIIARGSQEKDYALSKSIISWRKNNELTGFEVKDLKREIYLLEKENENQQKEMEDLKVELQKMKMEGSYNIDIMTGKRIDKGFKQTLKQIKECEEVEDNLPDQLKEKIQDTFLRNYALVTKNDRLKIANRELKERCREQEFQLGVRIRKGKARLKLAPQNKQKKDKEVTED